MKRLLAVALVAFPVCALAQNSESELKLEEIWLPLAGHEYVFVSTVGGVYVPIVIRFFDDFAMVDGSRARYVGEQLAGRDDGDRAGTITLEYLDVHVIEGLVVMVSDFQGIHHCSLVFARSDGSGYHHSPKSEGEYCVFGYRRVAE